MFIPCAVVTAFVTVPRRPSLGGCQSKITNQTLFPNGARTSKSSFLTLTHNVNKIMFFPQNEHGRSFPKT